MSNSNRKFLIASRRERVSDTSSSNSSKSPPKNIANKRLQNLRKRLSDDSQKTAKTPTLSAQIKNIASPNPKQRPPATIPTPAKRKRRKSEPFEGNTSHKIFRKSGESFSSSLALTVAQNSPKPTATTAASPDFIPNSNAETMEWSSNEDDPGSSSGKCFYIVVDTNILISNMELVKKIMEMKINDEMIPIIFIPWMVIEELDFLKSDNRNRRSHCKAQEAIKFLEQHLNKKSDRIRGQTLEEVNQQTGTEPNQDSKIIACCLQVIKNHKNMILVTNDINMRNKAHFNHIPVSSHSEIESILARTNFAKSGLVLNKMINVCSQIINTCAFKAFGEKAASNMTAFRSRPETLQDCIGIFKKYWFSVFEETIMKQCKKAVDDLNNFLIKYKSTTEIDREISQLIFLCKRVCVYLKDVNEHKLLIENTLNEFNNIECS